MPSFPETVGGWLLDLLGFVGLGLGGAQAAAAAKLLDVQQDAFHDHPIRKIPAETLATMVVRGAIDHALGRSEAQYDGYGGDRFDAMVAATGNPPGFEEVMMMWRRGIVSERDVEVAIKQGNIKPEWIPFLKGLRERTLSAGEAVAAAVQNHLPYETAASRAAVDGVTRADFDVMFANAGNPPGPLEILNLWVRGYVDENTVDEALRESRLKNKYIEPLKKLAIRKVPMRTITTLLHNGAIDDDRAKRMLRELGYSEDDAAAIVLAAHHHATAAVKGLSVTNIKTLYAERVLSRDQATADLVTGGYDPVIAGQLLDLADSQALGALRKQAIGKVRAVYVAHHIDRAQAALDLDVLQVPSDQRDEMLELWDLEGQANVAVLTPAQILKAGKERVITGAECFDRLRNAGYNDTDALILMVLNGPVTPEGGPDLSTTIPAS